MGIATIRPAVEVADVRLLAANFDPGWLFLAGCALLASLLMRRSFRYFGRPQQRGGSGVYLEHVRRPQTAWDGMQHDSFAQIERQKVELYDMTRDAVGQIESKMILLEQLIGTSQLQIEKLEALLAQLESRPADAAR